MRFPITYVPYVGQPDSELVGFRVGAPVSIDIAGRHFDLGDIVDVEVAEDGSINYGVDLDPELVAEIHAIFHGS